MHSAVLNTNNSLRTHPKHIKLSPCPIEINPQLKTNSLDANVAHRGVLQYAIQYKFNRQNDRTTPNVLKTHLQTQNNARMGFIITNLKNKKFQKLKFFPAIIGGRALTSGRALTPILET